MTLTTLSTIAACSLAVLAGTPGGMSATDAAAPFDADAHRAKLAELEPRTGLPVGWTVPDGKIKTIKGESTTLHKLIEKAEGPVVLVFYRGGWCPYCTKHLAALGRNADKFKKLGATVIAVSPESFEKLEVTEEQAKLAEKDYTLVSDPDHTLIKRFNLLFDVDEGTQDRYRNYGIDLDTWNADGEWKLPVPAAYVVNTDRKITWRHVDEDYRKRVNIRKLLKAIEEAG